MGAWDELDTLITVDTDTQLLDDLLDYLDGDEIFEPLYETIDNLKNGIDEGSKK